MDQGLAKAVQRSAPAIAPWAICLALAVGTTWPLAKSPATSLPLGYEAVPTVPFLNVWTVWWNTDRLAQGLTKYWQAPIFFPEANSFAFSEAQPLTAFTAPLAWGFSSVAAYNAFLIIALTLNGVCALRLLRRLDLPPAAAWLGAILVIILPFVHWQLGVLQLISLWGVLWTLSALLQLSRQPPLSRSSAVWNGLQLGAAFATTYLLCNYYGLFLSVLLTLSTPWLLGRRLRKGSTWISLVTAGLTAGLIMAPVVVMQLHSANGRHDWHRDAEEVRLLSAELLDFTTPVVSRFSRTSFTSPERSDTWRLAPGLFCSLLTVIGLVSCLRRTESRNWGAFCLSLVIWAGLFSLGTTYDLHGWSIYRGLASVWPGFAQIRSPFRFAVFVQLGLALLAAQGWSAIHARCLSALDRSRPRWTTLALRGAVGLLAALAVFENWPRRAVLADTPRIDENRRWLDWITQNTPESAVLTCLPMPAEMTAEAYVTEAEWMFWQTRHRRRITNGYSGFFPATYWELDAACHDFPSPEAAHQMALREVTHCVVHQGRLTYAQRDRLAQSQRHFPLLFHDVDTDISVHAVDGVFIPPAPRPSSSAGSP